MQLGELIASRRATHGLSQTALATACGVTREAVSNIERGLVERPRTDTIVPIALMLGLHENHLRTRGMDEAADALLAARRTVRVPAEELAEAVEGLALGTVVALRRVSANVYEVELPSSANTDIRNRPEAETEAPARVVRRTG